MLLRLLVLLQQGAVHTVFLVVIAHRMGSVTLECSMVPSTSSLALALISLGPSDFLVYVSHPKDSAIKNTKTHS